MTIEQVEDLERQRDAHQALKVAAEAARDGYRAAWSDVALELGLPATYGNNDLQPAASTLRHQRDALKAALEVREAEKTNALVQYEDARKHWAEAESERDALKDKNEELVLEILSCPHHADLREAREERDALKAALKGLVGVVALRLEVGFEDVEATKYKLSVARQALEEVEK